MKKIHHIGIAVSSIEDALEFHINTLGMVQISKIIHDPIQKVNLVLLGFNDNKNEGTRIELVEPAESPSPIDGTLKRKNHLYHYCIEVESLEEALIQARSNKSIIVRRPVPAKLFNNRKIAWILTPSQYLIEFLEKENTVDVCN
ncbi:MAG: VOC family protein [Candidatus Hodarchaeales archaeon]